MSLAEDSKSGPLAFTYTNEDDDFNAIDLHDYESHHILDHPKRNPSTEFSWCRCGRNWWKTVSSVIIITIVLLVWTVTSSRLSLPLPNLSEPSNSHYHHLSSPPQSKLSSLVEELNDHRLRVNQVSQQSADLDGRLQTMMKAYQDQQQLIEELRKELQTMRTSQLSSTNDSSRSASLPSPSTSSNFEHHDDPSTTHHPSTTSSSSTVSAPPASASLDSHGWVRNRTALISLLHQQVSSIRARYPTGMDFNSSHVRFFGTHARAEKMNASIIPSTLLTTALTESYLGQRASVFTIGVTGGSSTPGKDSYPALLKAWFANQLNMTIEIRNAGQGSTSQLQTAACMYQIIGDKTPYASNTSGPQSVDTESYLTGDPVDLLLWEFGMNDEGWHFVNDNRKVATEAYIRGFLTHGQHLPLAIGFVHLWDISTHHWNWFSPNRIPDLSWLSTNEVLKHYSPYLDTFGINVIRFFIGPSCLNASTSVMLNPPPTSCVSACPKCVEKQKPLVRDNHHPNKVGYATTLDLFTHSLLVLWLEALEHEVATFQQLKASKPTLQSLPPDAIPVHKPNPQQALSLPYYAPDKIVTIESGMRSACLMGVEPLFAPPDPHLRIESCNRGFNHDATNQVGVEFTGSSHVYPGFQPICPNALRVPYGRFDPLRGDRKLPWNIPVHNCSTASFGWNRQVNQTKSVTANKIIHDLKSDFEPPLVIHFQAMNRLRYLILECVPVNCPGMQVNWNNRTLISNTNAHKTMYADTFRWVHYFTDEEIKHSIGKPTSVALTFCPSAQVPQLMLLRMIVWFQTK